jgi:hypothetical protein
VILSLHSNEVAAWRIAEGRIERLELDAPVSERR